MESRDHTTPDIAVSFSSMTLDVLPATPHVEVSGQARLGHDGWVSEFEAFQWEEEKRSRGPSNAGAVPATGRSGRSTAAAVARGKSSSTTGGIAPAKAMDNLRAEIKLLHWHKLANEAALKAALLKTKKIKARGGGTSKPVPAMTTLSMPTEERAAWMQQVIEEEQSKPLQVSKDFMCKYEEQEKETDGRLDTEVAGHIRSLRNLRKQVHPTYSRTSNFCTTPDISTLDYMRTELNVGALKWSDDAFGSTRRVDPHVVCAGLIILLPYVAAACVDLKTHFYHQKHVSVSGSASVHSFCSPPMEALNF